MATLNTALRTEQIVDDAIDNAKLANITRGSIKVGGAADAPTDLDAKSDANILIGDGTDLASVAVSGDVTIDNAGAVSIGADKVTKLMIASDIAGDGIAQAAGGELDLDLNELTAAVVDVTADSIAIIDATDNSSKKESIDDLITGLAGDGIQNTASQIAVDVSDFAGTGLKDEGSEDLAVDLYEVGEVVVDVANDSFALMDNSDSDETKRDTIADLVTAIAGTGLTAAAGVLSVTAILDNIVETDIKFEDESANCNGITTAFTLASTPVTNSVQVFLNGLLQQVGSGKDYTLSGTTVTFVTAPATNDILLIHYIVNG